MDNIFDRIGKKASETYKYTAEKTGKIAKCAKLKIQISELKSDKIDIFEEIGENVYGKYKNGSKTINIEKDLGEECKKIKEIESSIEKLEAECLELEDKKICPKCKIEMKKEIKYCPECGQKQPKIKEEKVIEAEVIEENNKEEKENSEKPKEKPKKEENKIETKKTAKPTSKKETTDKKKEELEKTVKKESGK